jgi:hypothetical protein
MQLLQPPDDYPDTASRDSYHDHGEQGTGYIFIGHDSSATCLGPVGHTADQPNGVREPAGISEDEVKNETSYQRE